MSKATITVCGLTVLGTLTGCTTGPKETRKDVAKIKWDCNPILPIPENACYTGANNHIDPVRFIKSFEYYYGTTPTIHDMGYTVSSNNFPEDDCKTMIEMGTIPVLRYNPVDYSFKGYYGPIIKGKIDDQIRKDAHNMAKFGHPILLIPFMFPNEANRVHFDWGAHPADQYKEAWIRMHELIKKEGANNVVWITKLKMGRWRDFSYPDPFNYIPPKEYVDIIGWACNNHIKPEIGLYSQSFNSLFNYYYKNASRKFPTLPQMFLELSSASNNSQYKWMDDALNTIKTKYYRVIGVLIDEQPYWSEGNPYGGFDPGPTPKSREVIRKHFTGSYYIGSILKRS